MKNKKSMTSKLVVKIIAVIVANTPIILATKNYLRFLVSESMGTHKSVTAHPIKYALPSA